MSPILHLFIGGLILSPCVPISMAVDVDDIKDYNDIVLLVSDVQSYYQAASVFVVYSGDDESLETTSLLHRLQREFSGKFVPSLTLNYSDITMHHEIYRDHIVKPLFIVLLASAGEVDWFRGLTANYDMSYAVWIVIFTEAIMDVCYEPTGNHFNLAFDTEMLVKCSNDPVIREWYSLHEGHTKVFDLATWDPENRLQLMTEEGLFERRRDLEGKTFPIVIVKDSKAIAELEGGILVGYFADVLLELSRTLNFSVRITFKEDHYGLYNETLGQWTGAIGRLARGQVEFGVSAFTITNSRLKVVDFTPPILLSHNLLFISQPQGSALNWSAYFKVYSSLSWWCIEVIVFVSFIFITILRKLMMKQARASALPPDHLSQNFLQVFGIFAQQGLPELPEQSSMRLAYYSMLLMSVVLYAVYSACLISYLTVSIPSLPFTDLEGFAEDASYRFVTMRDSAPYELVKTSSDAVLQKVATLMPEPAALPSTITDCFKQVCAGRAAFYSDGSIKNLNSRVSCGVVAIDIGRIDSLAIAMKKKSNYRGLINFHLLKFMASGILYRMRSHMNEKVAPAENQYIAVNFYSIGPILTVLAGGVSLSLLLFCAEIAAWRVERRRARRRRGMTSLWSGEC